MLQMKLVEQNLAELRALESGEVSEAGAIMARHRQEEKEEEEEQQQRQEEEDEDEAAARNWIRSSALAFRPAEEQQAVVLFPVQKVLAQ